MSMYDDKRFILSHIRHSFITCDDTGMCETVMLNENPNRYPYESIYHHPFNYDSDDYYESDDENKSNSYENFKYADDEIDLLQKTQLEYQSDLVDDDQPSQSLDIMSESYDLGIRRRSNTAQKLEKLKKERKNQSEIKTVYWKSSTQIVSQTEEGNRILIKRIVVDAENLPPEELELLEYDKDQNVYYETEEYRKFLFPKKEIIIETPPELLEVKEMSKDKQEAKFDKNRRKSVLTQTIEQSPVAPINPFNEFTRFDGRVSDSNAHIKRIRIFFKINDDNPDYQPYDFSSKFSSSMSGLNCGPDWIEVIVLANARICDLIGLICWHYTHLQIGPPLKPDLSAYALKIAEENGYVDNDFPSLNFTDDIKRYGFPCLALVPVEIQITVTVYIENVFSQLTINSPSTTLKEILDQIKKKRSHLFKNRSLNIDSENFRLEQRSVPGVALDWNSPISKYVEKNENSDPTAEFSLIFIQQELPPKIIIPDNSEKCLSLPRTLTGLRLNKSSSALYNMDKSNNLPKKKLRSPKDLSSNMFDIMNAPLYQCFEVQAMSKLYNSPVEMGISETKLEITPKAHPRSPSSHFTEKLLSRFQGIKAMTIDVEDVVECHLVPIHKPIAGKQIFKIVYWNGTDFKSIKFEGDYTTVDDIVFKLQHVMKMRTSVRRNEYQSMQNRKKNISTKVYMKSKISSSSESCSDETFDDTNQEEQESKNYDFFRKRDSKFLKFRSKNFD